MKQKLLFIGIKMDCAGTEKSFLSFLSALDFSSFDVDLLLAKREGLFLDMIPKEVNIIELPEYGDLFTMSGKNAASTLFRLFVKKNPLTGFVILPYFLRIILCPKKREFTATRLWCKMMSRLPRFSDATGNNTVYDAAVAYWGDRTMFYMADKVDAKKKIAWLHFDYGNPPRDDALYTEYFSKCDNIVTVSESVDKALRNKLPEIAPKCVMIENIMNPKHIWDLALKGESFPDGMFSGKRILTIGRICEQKGVKTIVPVLKKLRESGKDVKWYLIGTGDKDYVDALKIEAFNAGVADILIFLGTTVNPYPYLRDCDIYVQPSIYEGKPITVEEAKIMFKPIVACNYLSANEQLGNGKYGLVCGFEPDMLYTAVDKVLSDQTLCENFSNTLSKLDGGNSDEIEKFYKLL